MATIFEKVPASGERCIILEPREALLYSFDFGDWRQIRMAAFLSLTTIGDNNGEPVDETIDPNSQARSQLYFGFKDSGLLIPRSSGTMYAGLIGGLPPAYVGTDQFSYNSTNGYIAGNNNGMIFTSGDAVMNSHFFGATFRVGVSSRVILDTGYAKLSVLVMNRNSSSDWSGVFTYFAIGGNDYTDVSVRNLRASMENITVNNNTFSCSGYFPNELNSAFIYCPLNNNRLRVHALVVEKYA